MLDPYVIYFCSSSAFASSTCTRDWIEISSSSEVCSDKGILHNRYCGLTFGTNIESDTDQDFNTQSSLDTILSRPKRTVCGEFSPNGTEIHCKYLLSIYPLNKTLHVNC